MKKNAVVILYSPRGLLEFCGIFVRMEKNITGLQFAPGMGIWPGIRWRYAGSWESFLVFASTTEILWIWIY